MPVPRWGRPADRERILKVRIFALAKELGVENKQLFELAAEAGLDIKNSPLASVTAEQADTLRAASKGAPAPADKSGPTQPVRETAPRREAVPDRSLKDLGRTGPLGHRRRQAAAEELAEDEPAVDEPAVDEVSSDRETQVAAEPGEQPPVAERADATSVEPAADTTDAPAADVPAEESPQPSENEEAPAAAEKPAASAAGEEEPVSESSESEAETPAAKSDGESKPDGGDDATASSAKPAPGPSDKSPASESKPTADAAAGKAAAKPAVDPNKPVRPKPRMSVVREMKAVGTVRGSGKRAKKEATLPNIVLPSIKGPIGGQPKEEEAAQKPEVRLTADILKQNSPLSQIRKRAEARLAKEAAAGITAAKRPASGGGIEQARAQRRRNRRGRVGADEDRIIRRTLRRGKRRRPSNFELKSEATVELPVDIRGLSEAIGRPARDIIRVFMNEGEMKTINDFLSEEEALEVALDLGVELQFKQKESIEDKLLRRVEEGIPEGAKTTERPPIITILGHVDHGKTTLVDKLRGANVAGGEAGGITQHIAAYQVRSKDGRKLTFVDTPGHAAFGEMRVRGANVTDIIVLVVAADDGVMPQTVESISHAKAAGVPIVVAMTKCDLPDRNEQKVLTDLSTNELLPSEYGGDTDVVRVSAMSGEGIDELLETILLTAELQEYKAAVDVPSYGVCLEGFRDEGRGPMAWTIVQQGTLKVGDTVLCGPSFGRVRAMYDDNGKSIKKAGPSTPVKVAGLDEVPGAGDRFFETDNVEEAREVAELKRVEGRDKLLARRGGGAKTMEQILAGSGPKELPVIIKADTPGSVEAIVAELEKFEHEEVGIRFLHEAVGGVNESDVYLAASSGATIIAFQVVPDDLASSLADKEKVEIKRYSIIYEITDEIRNMLEGMLEPEKREVATGRAIVLQTFSISRFGTIAGCRVLSGTIQRNGRVHVIRDQQILNDYAIASLKREKDDAKEVREGFECGIRLDGFNDIKEGDLLEAYRIEEIKRTLDS